jgi:hypothetical protein
MNKQVLTRSSYEIDLDKKTKINFIKNSLKIKPFFPGDRIDIGKLKNKKFREFYSLKNSFDPFYLYIEQQKQNNFYKLAPTALKRGIPSFGALLCGSFSRKSPLLNFDSIYPSFIKLDVNLIRKFDSPEFDICYMNVDTASNKGQFLVVPGIKLKLYQTYNVTRKYSPKSSDSIKILDTKLAISDNSSDAVSDDKVENKLRYYIVGDNSGGQKILTVNSRNKFIASGIGEYDNVNELIESYPKHTYYKANSKDVLSEKLFGLMHSGFVSVNAFNRSFLVPSQRFSIQYVDLLVLMLFEECKNHLSDDAKTFFNVRPYIIFEYFLSKIYYAIRNSDDSFEYRNILQSKNISHDRSIFNAGFNGLDRVIMSKFARPQSLSYENYFTGKRVIEGKIFDDVYKLFVSESIKEILKLIYKHITYIKHLDPRQCSFQNNELTISRNLFDL